MTPAMGRAPAVAVKPSVGSRAVSAKRWSRGMGVHALATGKPSVVPATWKALTVAGKTGAGVGSPGGGGGVTTAAHVQELEKGREGRDGWSDSMAGDIKEACWLGSWKLS